MKKQVRTSNFIQAIVRYIGKTTAGSTMVQLTHSFGHRPGDLCWINGVLVYWVKDAYYFNAEFPINLNDVVSLSVEQDISVSE